MRNRAWLLCLLTTVGCGRGCDEKPYVPYAIGDGAPGDAGQRADSGMTASEPDAGLSLTSSVMAPPQTTKMDVSGVEIAAEPGKLLVHATLAGTVERGDVLVVVRPKAAPAPLELVLFHLEGRAVVSTKKLLSTAEDVVDMSCTPQVAKEERGDSAFELALSFGCAGHGQPPSRTVVLASTGPSGLRLRYAAEVRDRAADPPILAHIDVTDVDKDGVPDVTLVVSSQGSAAKVVMIDRPAGLSRNAGEPEASFASLERGAAARADKKDGKKALEEIAKLRTLYRALCQEKPRVRPIFGANAPSCADSPTMQRAQTTFARALAQTGERLRSVYELDAATRMGGKADLAVLAPLVTRKTVKETKTFDRVVQKGAGGGASFSPLAFDADGTLLLRVSEADGVVRADSGEQSPVAAWPLGVSSPDAAQRLLEIYDPCDEAALKLTLAGATSSVDLSLPVEPLFGRKCEGTRGGAVSAAPIAWTDAGLSLVVLGQLVNVTNLKADPAERPAAFASGRGGAASQKGPWLVVRTPLGIAVDDGKKTVLLVDSEKKPVRGGACVVSDDGAHVACVDGDKPVLYGL
jgi:hypothetical protein